MKIRRLTRFILAIVLLLPAVLTSAEGRHDLSALSKSETGENTGTDLPGFSEEQKRLMSSLIGRFVLDGFRGEEELYLPEEMKTLYIDNDEMYYVVQRQQYLIDAIDIMGGGRICDLSLQKVDLKDALELSADRTRVSAYVKLVFRYADDPGQHETGAGMEVAATLLKTADDCYKIEYYTEKTTDFDAMRDDYRFFCEQKRQEGIVEPRKLTDLYFAERLSVLRIAKEQEEFVDEQSENLIEEDESGEDISSRDQTPASRLTVNYNRSDAVRYALNEGFREEDLIFYSIPGQDGDCTNFVSQAMWVGYGGDIGDYYNWITYDQNSTYLYNCKYWAWMKYRMIPGESGWYGTSKKQNSFSYPSGSWMRVWQLWAYLSTTSSGPRAYKYNDGDYYFSTSLIIQSGDILQFSPNPSNGGYKHSAIVVNNANQTLSGNGIYVAQHTYNTGWRQLTSLISSLGPYVRIIRPISGSFVE